MRDTMHTTILDLADAASDLRAQVACLEEDNGTLRAVNADLALRLEEAEARAREARATLPPEDPDAVRLREDLARALTERDALALELEGISDELRPQAGEGLRDAVIRLQRAADPDPRTGRPGGADLLADFFERKRLLTVANPTTNAAVPSPPPAAPEDDSERILAVCVSRTCGWKGDDDEARTVQGVARCPSCNSPVHFEPAVPVTAPAPPACACGKPATGVLGLESVPVCDGCFAKAQAPTLCTVGDLRPAEDGPAEFAVAEMDLRDDVGNIRVERGARLYLAKRPAFGKVWVRAEGQAHPVEVMASGRVRKTGATRVAPAVRGAAYGKEAPAAPAPNAYDALRPDPARAPDMRSTELLFLKAQDYLWGGRESKSAIGTALTEGLDAHRKGDKAGALSAAQRALTAAKQERGGVTGALEGALTDLVQRLERDGAAAQGAA